MSQPEREPLHLTIAPDFDLRAAATRERLAAGEDLRIDEVADALGLPSAFVGAAAAIAAALASGETVILQPVPLDAMRRN